MADKGAVGDSYNPASAADDAGADIPDSALTAIPYNPAVATLRTQPWNQTGAGSGQPVVGASIQIG
jgi:hypothetical protein